MSIHYDIQILRSKLIAMTRLTQRTVDYSVKAMQLGRPELCRVAHHSKDELSAIRCWIASHGRAVLADETCAGADSRFASVALRISDALQAANDAAIHIAQQTQIRFAIGWVPVSPELDHAGQFVNSLLRLCVLSLLNRDVRHAKEVLHDGEAGQSVDLAVHLAPGKHPTSAQARFELAITRDLDVIAGQTRDIADAIILWLEESGMGKVAGGGATHKPVRHTAMLASPACTVPASEKNSPCKLPASLDAILPRRALRWYTNNDRGIPSRGFAEPVPTEDFTPARLMRLQQRVCELLVKNQQLRMALIAEKADCHHDQLC